MSSGTGVGSKFSFTLHRNYEDKGRNEENGSDSDTPLPTTDTDADEEADEFADSSPSPRSRVKEDRIRLLSQQVEALRKRLRNSGQVSHCTDTTRFVTRGDVFMRLHDLGYKDVCMSCMCRMYACGYFSFFEKTNLEFSP